MDRQYANIAASEEHYLANKEAYHQIAVEEAHATGRDIVFSGDEAVNVEEV